MQSANFIVSVSKTSAKTFRDKIKSLEIYKKTGCKIDMIAEILNPMLRGWMNYFGKVEFTFLFNAIFLIKCNTLVRENMV